MLTLGLIADLHLGPPASHRGARRKLSQLAPELAGAFAARMRDVVRPDLVVNLGDVIEDDAPELDRQRYEQGLGLLRAAGAPLVNVAGNHDRVHLGQAELRRAWGLEPEGELYRSFDCGGAHFVVLYGHERKDRDVRLGEGQLRWLAADLGRTTLPTVVLMHHSAADQDLRGNRWFEGASHICLVAERGELRALVRASGRVVAVFCGHLHWNHLDLVDGIPYVTLQSPIENINEDEPAVPAAAYAVVRLGDRRLHVEVLGAQPARYQFELGP
ncbi:MAG: metallophosphoesterase [Deltaproteobacteria bacterium]|nr:metallophosphoesterase [Deltaproteobacteria bacterium]